ncbi:MAG: TlpA disulfide reductase family protein [Vicinamibacteria bacterium]
MLLKALRGWLYVFLLLTLVQGASAASGVKEVLAAKQGRVVVLNFWASWCEPCKREMPMLDRLSREYAARGADVVSVSIDDDEEWPAAEAFVKKRRLTYPTLDRATTSDMASFKLGAEVPGTVIIDRDGTSMFRLIGEMREADLRSRLDWLLGDRVAARPAELSLPEGMSVDHFVTMHESVSVEHHDEGTAEDGSSVPG